MEDRERVFGSGANGFSYTRSDHLTGLEGLYRRP